MRKLTCDSCDWQASSIRFLGKTPCGYWQDEIGLDRMRDPTNICLMHTELIPLSAEEALSVVKS